MVKEKRKRPTGSRLPSIVGGALLFAILIRTMTFSMPPSPTPISIVETRGTTTITNTCDSPARAKFDEKYQKGQWSQIMKSPSEFYGDSQWPPKAIRQRSASGKGSWLGYNTETSMQQLKETIQKYNIKSMVDMPCGDVNWIFDSFETDSLPLYVGLDVASAVIEVNKKRFAHHKNKEFHFWDASHCAVPRFFNETSSKEETFDLVHVRDVVQHMSIDLGVKYFCNVFKSGAKFLLTTTFPGHGGEHKNVVDGDFYKNDLSQEPFAFPEPSDPYCVRTHPNTEDDLTCLYDLREAGWVSKYLRTKC